MDYDELKRKYGVRSARKTRSAAAALLVVVACAVVAAYFIYKPTDAAQKVLDEINSISPSGDTTSLLQAERCTSLSKSASEWTITGCKDDLSIRLVFRADGGYSMKVCGDWSDGKEAFEAAKDALAALGLSTDCDAGTINLLKTEEGTDVYNVCGSELYLKGGCIV
jgi:hypothetical protein